MNKIRGILLDGYKSEVVEIEHTVENLRKLIGCSCLDITSRILHGRRYYFVCDDMGWYKKDIVVTGVYDGSYTDIAFVGKIFIVAFNGVDDICSLSDDDIEFLNSLICCYIHIPV